MSKRSSQISLAQISLERHLRNSSIAAIFLVGGMGYVGATSELSGAVVAIGSLVVDTNIKKIQHPTGGIVAELNVREGDQVQANQILIKLDETVARASLATVEKDLRELRARQARLEAERDQQDEILFPADMDVTPASETGRIIEGEIKLFHFRRDAADGQKRQLRERITQLNEKISGLKVQYDAKLEELRLIRKELEGVQELWDKKLVPLTRMIALERNQARLDGESGQLTASIAESRGRIAETELQIIQVDQDMRSDVARQLADIRAKIAELNERFVTAQDQLKRIDIRSPQSGIVHQLSVHTQGGVIAAGEQIMLIVPDADKLAVEVKVAPSSVDQVHVGQDAVLRFSSFNQRSTPEIGGKVTLVSASTSKDDKAETTFYTVRIAMDPKSTPALGDVRLIPGMPVDAYLRTSERTILSYLVKPLSDQMHRAFRER
ncbi:MULTISPECIES: HlyD family type I secretion periplasmic adaptor subunit [unclassified Beijerinckia]|uniref:HlyD family type I secretion periplasmic adaptor subunit n=1 Tax=unclassified Beijerinckia TaxID=2638183 RepID=UPI000895F975|nr:MULTISPECIES: HlyD family type I secretion periplasmic adaptor subunit [unclassified Beijerinckia]MDH7795979.1 HlyD family secretion protein [Beijerinckia sp. GAS462]SEC24825.1 membrane fusion protein PrsE [Beijerinckia sp. 28-YEA-48]